MTALVSAFCHTYHSERGGAKVFDNTNAAKLLTAEKRLQIGGHMAAGAPFFVPDLWRNAEQALCLLVK